MHADPDELAQAARQEHGLRENTLLAYQRTWRRLFARAGSLALDPAMLTAGHAAQFYREIVAGDRSAAPSTESQGRAALAFAYAHWHRPNPFANIPPPRRPSPSPGGSLPAHDLARLLHRLDQRQATYGESLTCHLAAALFHTRARFSEIARLRWRDCLRDAAGRIEALRIPRTRNEGDPVTLPVEAALSGRLDEWRSLQEQHRGMKVFAAQGLKFCRSEYVFAGPGGEPYTNQSFNAHLKRACQELGLAVVLTAHGLRHSAARILLDDQRRDLRDVQRLLRHRDIRTTARYTFAAPAAAPPSATG